jgi:hypothetical protein
MKKLLCALLIFNCVNIKASNKGPQRLSLVTVKPRASATLSKSLGAETACFFALGSAAENSVETERSQNAHINAKAGKEKLGLPSDDEVEVAQSARKSHSHQRSASHHDLNEVFDKAKASAQNPGMTVAHSARRATDGGGTASTQHVVVKSKYLQPPTPQTGPMNTPRPSMSACANTAPATASSKSASDAAASNNSNALNTVALSTTRVAVASAQSQASSVNPNKAIVTVQPMNRETAPKSKKACSCCCSHCSAKCTSCC